MTQSFFNIPCRAVMLCQEGQIHLWLKYLSARKFLSNIEQIWKVHHMCVGCIVRRIYASKRNSEYHVGIILRSACELKFSCHATHQQCDIILLLLKSFHGLVSSYLSNNIILCSENFFLFFHAENWSTTMEIFRNFLW